MNRFITTLRTEKVGYDGAGRPTLRLEHVLGYQSDRCGLITVPAGFVTNYASVPRLPVIFLVAGDRAHEQAALHDYLYTVHAINGVQIERDVADAVFLEALQAPLAIPPSLDRPISPVLAKLMFHAVRQFGESSWNAPTLVPQPRHIREQIDAADMVAA